jgi:acetyl esterase/lipase
MFEILLWTFFIISTFIFLKAFIGRKWWQPRMCIGKAFKGIGLTLSFFTSISILSFSVLEATAPKGSLAYEAVRLPRHYYEMSKQENANIKVSKIKYGKSSRQYLLVCEPISNVPSKDKIVLFIHGGGWHSGTPERNLKMADFLALEGYTVILPTYRRGPVYDQDEILEDIEVALGKTLEIMKLNGWKHKRIVLGGTSAGGHLAALLLYDIDRHKRLGIQQSAFAGMFSLAGPLDISEMDETLVLRRFAGKSGTARFDKANPVCYVSGKEKVPVLCIQGSADGMVPSRSADSFIRRISAEDGSRVVYIKIEGATHIDITSGWYYNAASDFGQVKTLKSWLNSL